MFKKLNSNPEENPNFFIELKKEFGKNAASFSTDFRSFCEKHPKQIFIGMVVTIALSAIISFAVISPMHRRDKEKATKMQAEAVKSEPKQSTNMPGNNIGDVLTATGNMKAVFELKLQVDSILAKPALTAQDSLNLHTLLNQLRDKQKQINPTK